MMILKYDFDKLPFAGSARTQFGTGWPAIGERPLGVPDSGLDAKFQFVGQFTATPL